MVGHDGYDMMGVHDGADMMEGLDGEMDMIDMAYAILQANVLRKCARRRYLSDAPLVQGYVFMNNIALGVSSSVHRP